MPSNAVDGAGAARLLQQGLHGDPFSVLGRHKSGEGYIVRAFMPQTQAVQLVDIDGALLGDMERVGDSDLFQGDLPGEERHYRFRVTDDRGGIADLEDAYRFQSPLGDLDLHLIGQGAHHLVYEKLGAHPIQLQGVDGVQFAVWAPNARRVSVVGDFNGWDGRRHVMRFHPSVGIWDIFVPGVRRGAGYKFELLGRDGAMLPLKSDPFALYCEQPPGNAALVFVSAHEWQDDAWMRRSERSLELHEPVSIYEVHLGSWRRNLEESNRYLGYRELAHELIPYVVEMGFTHIELLPVSEHPFGGSWGYQPTGLYAPTSRFGDPDDFRYFIDHCHQNGVGVIVDWVGAHFPRDPHGLGRFDGTALYEHEDPRRGTHADWDTLVYNYGRREVVNFLIANALFWIREYHIDGLRIDAVASMLYLDYSREPGEWIPNEYGGNENIEAIDLLRRFNELVHAEGGVTFAEESTAWPGVSKPTYAGGLGFSYKWNMGWMNDTLAYVREDPIHRKYHHDRMTFGLVYAFNENFVLPLSHDEVVHGKGSLIGKMPGDEWQRFAGLRAYFGFMFAHPGKKLIFMGCEFAQTSEWNHNESLDWHLLTFAPHAGVHQLVRDLNRLYRETPELHEVDFDGAGFRWLDWNDRDNSVFAWLRYARNGDWLVCLTNFTPVVREDYLIGVPAPGAYSELLNTDAIEYGGSGVGNLGKAQAVAAEHGDFPASMRVTLPPLATVYFAPAKD